MTLYLSTGSTTSCQWYCTQPRSKANVVEKSLVTWGGHPVVGPRLQGLAERLDESFEAGAEGFLVGLAVVGLEAEGGEAEG